MSNRGRIWFLLHGWISLPVWFLFAFICVTGTICVISHELTWITNPNSRANNPQNLPEKQIAELIESAKNSVPDSQVVNVMTLEPYLATAIELTSPEKPSVTAYVNPYSGEVQELFEGITFISFMRSLHAWLLFPWEHRYSIGYYIVTLCSLILIAACITGLLAYKKFWKSYTKPKLRINQGLRKFSGDFHKLAAIWSLWFFAIIAFTGLWYLTQAIFWHNDINMGEAKPEAIALGSVPKINIEKISLAQALDIAHSNFNSFSPAWISLPEHSRGFISIAGKGTGLLYDQYSYKIDINPWSGAVESISNPENMTLLEKVSHIADPLHYGRFAGFYSKIIWFIFGSLLSTMSVSGLIIWIKRTSPKDTKSISKGFFLINMLIVLFPLYFIYSFFNPKIQPGWGEKTAEDITVTAIPANYSKPYPEGAGFQKDFSFNFCRDCASKIKLASAAIATQPPQIDDSLKGILHGHGDSLHAHVPTPQNISPEDRLWVSIEKWDGNVIKLYWDIQK